MTAAGASRLSGQLKIVALIMAERDVEEIVFMKHASGRNRGLFCGNPGLSKHISNIDLDLG